MGQRVSEKFVKKITKADEQQAEAIFSSLLRDRDFLRKIIDALADGLLVVRSNLEILLANEAVWRLLGLATPSKPIGRRLTEFPIPSEIAKKITRFLLGESEERQFEVELPGHEQRWLQISLSPFKFQSDHEFSELLTIVVRDVTAWYRAEEQRRRAEYWKQMATLAAGLAHEIKNPLNSLQIHAQLLQRALRQKVKRARSLEMQRQLQSSDIIVEEIKRLGCVVNEFLAAVRPSRPMLQRANVNYHIERVLQTIRPEAEARGVRLVTSLDYEIPPVDFDPNQMTQVLLNLLKNALEALSGVEGAMIEIATELHRDHYVIRVRDNGHGISAQDLDRIQEPFFTTKATGTGLGLAIVSRIVEEHGGKIQIQSHVGKGTTVVLRFPLSQRAVRMIEEAQPAPVPSAPVAESSRTNSHGEESGN
ncbi:MAG: sensor histidine kinase [Candidatus Sumerlaeaceae bacterium]|jgi:PAS domain S-box-containing protein